MSSQKPIAIWDDPNTYDFSTYSASNFDEFIVNENNKIFDPTQPFDIYRDCKSISRSQNVPWQKCADYAIGTPNTLSKAAVGVRFAGTNGQEDSPTTLGWLKVTWYVTFRGIKL